MVAVVEPDADELADLRYRLRDADLTLDQRQGLYVYGTQPVEPVRQHRPVEVRDVIGQRTDPLLVVQQSRLLAAQRSVTE
jgi:hypothetical protein